MTDNDAPTGSRRQREIRHGSDDPAKSAWIDSLLKRRADQAADGDKSFVGKVLGIPDKRVRVPFGENFERWLDCVGSSAVGVKTWFTG